MLRMRRTALAFAAALALSFAAMQASAQDDEASLETLLENVARIMRAVEILEVVETSILLTDQECESLRGWTNYTPIGGRFPLAAGTGRDVNNEQRTFGFEPEPSRHGGTYRHTLIVQEMPAHTHDYIDTHSREIRADYGDDEPGALHDSRRTTQSTGEGSPHNNMPPYLVLNFCHKK